MTASHARQLDLLSIEEYLAGEQRSAVKHEYVDGVIELPEIDCELSMASVYAEVVFPSTPGAAGSEAES